MTQHECPAQKEDYQHSLERSGQHQIDSGLSYASGFQAHRGGTDECQYDTEGHLISLHFRSSGGNNVVDDYVEAGVVRMVDNGATVTDQLADLGVMDPRRGASNYTGISAATLAALNGSVVASHCRMVRGPRMLLWTRAAALSCSKLAPVVSGANCDRRAARELPDVHHRLDAALLPLRLRALPALLQGLLLSRAARHAGRRNRRR